MESETLKKYFQNIEDFVFIDNKIVTCIWLSQTLKVHVNTAKQLMHAFLLADGNKDKVVAFFILGGELKDGLGSQLKLVPGHEREAAKNLFSKLTTDHVYSIQNSARELNSIDLFNAYPQFYIDPENHRFCAVKPSKEIEKREVKVPVPVVEPKKITNLQPPKTAKPAENNVQKPTSEGNHHDSKHRKSPEKNNKPQSKGKASGGGIAGMFSRQADKNKNESTANKNKDAQNEKPENKVDKKKAGGISGFFQPQAAKKEFVEDEKMEVDSDAPIKEANNKVEEKEKENGEKKQEIEDVNKKTAKEKKIKGKENRKKRKKRDGEKEDDSRKKRKRIVSMLSSDSESSENNESECEMEPEPLPAPVAVVEEEEDIIPPTPGRKRVRKQIDKTYKDEDGFILTKKEYVYESCTDDENDDSKNNPKEKANSNEKDSIKENGEDSESKSKSDSKNEDKSKSDSKKNEDKKSTKKKSPSSKQNISPGNNNKGNKQASIMNFFKRK